MGADAGFRGRGGGVRGRAAAVPRAPRGGRGTCGLAGGLGTGCGGAPRASRAGGPAGWPGVGAAAEAESSPRSPFSRPAVPAGTDRDDQPPSREDTDGGWGEAREGRRVSPPPRLAGAARWPCDRVRSRAPPQTQARCRAALRNRFLAHRGSVHVCCPTRGPLPPAGYTSPRHTERCVSPGTRPPLPRQAAERDHPRAGPVATAGRSHVHRIPGLFPARKVTAPRVWPAEGQMRRLLLLSRKESGNIKNAFRPDRLNSFEVA